MRRTCTVLAAVLVAALLTAACSAPELPPPPARPATPDLAHLGPPQPEPERNRATALGIALGRRLFFDTRLSANGKLSCATCHQPERAFTDGERTSRAGVSGAPLARNTPSLCNVAWSRALFADGGAHDLESQAFAPLTAPDELAHDPDALVEELARNPIDAIAFAIAFPDGLTRANLARALAQFQRTLVCADSRWDRHQRGEPGGDLSPLERRGLEVFTRACAGCHPPGLFTDGDFHDIGLDLVFPEAEERVAWGRGRITGRRADIGRFKTPTLRNVTLTAPYMHDGRFATLAEVLEHYRRGVAPSLALDPRLRRSDGALGIALHDDEVEALLAFLATLTDLSLVDAGDGGS